MYSASSKIKSTVEVLPVVPQPLRYKVTLELTQEQLDLLYDLGNWAEPVAEVLDDRGVRYLSNNEDLNKNMSARRRIYDFIVSFYYITQEYTLSK